MQEDKNKFFLKFYECGNCHPDSEKNRKLQCIPGQKSFFFSLFEEKPPPKSKPDASKECKKEESPPCECPSVCEKEDKKPLPDSCKKACPVVCYIKEQNPHEPECCELKGPDDDDDDGGPCPPRGYVPPQERPPTCGCDLCKKSGFHGRCYDPRAQTGSSHRLERA
ncbi:hypothetical protein QAD02_017624 [Eretmocerus hayati]|uniref:Uncharacterized protein n=1 Tax=Eretmocerus hayati TaxID=131215 RepID=A0ACC2PER7_9HYME|nr:hypothetical protein QAD02_017624 [Eretmocerus hayati]